ncbi:MAG: hypothetical protein ACXABY_10800 [Candidatus Thorarchaeota archaeon]|jgi:hypothetical protein
MPRASEDEERRFEKFVRETAARFFMNFRDHRGGVLCLSIKKRTRDGRLYDSLRHYGMPIQKSETLYKIKSLKDERVETEEHLRDVKERIKLLSQMSEEDEDK